ncbi:hypothetical protein [Haloferax marisrubri]|uniref:Uncharacterized protein n=1 Tax=Haloferax marisrubri TaxID=1544719 RepID=A0A2P4NR14_9EURY|nr:hypothetical protein [Haloferax marisrubri]POG55573.1 hypothetical protein AUR65_009230 [Haloferax marisrubri]
MEMVRNVRELTAVLEQFSETTGAVRELELTSEGESAADGVLASVTVEYDLATGCGVEPNRLSVSSPAASITDGRLRLELDVSLAPPSGEDAGSESVSSGHAAGSDAEPTESRIARTDGSGTRNSAVVGPVASVETLTMEAAAPTVSDEAPERDQPASASIDDPVEADTVTETNSDADSESNATTSTQTETEADARADADSVPAHHDPVRLREAYEACETFKEMTDALGVDVTPQTVRNQMIQRGIHEPESYGAPTESSSSNESADAGDETPQSEPRVSDENRTSETEPEPESGDERDEGDEGPANATERDTRVDSEADATGEPTSASEPEPDPKSASKSDADTAPASDAEPVAADTDETSEVTEVAPTPATLPPLPASVSSLDCSTEDVCAAVTGAKTLYEVERRLGLDRADVREVLTALDLLDLVTGRMARRDASAASADDVRTRAHAALDANE